MMIDIQDRAIISSGYKSYCVILPKLWWKFKGLKIKDKIKCIITEKAVIYVKPGEDFEEIKKAFSLDERR